MKFKLYNPSTIKNAFESISRIIDETIIDFDNTGLHLTAIDRSHICFITLELEKSLFDEFTCETPTKIAVDTSELNKILKKCKNTDILEWNVDEHNLILIFHGDVTRKFKIRLIDLEYENQKPPMIESPVKITLPSNFIKDSLKDMSLFSESLTFIVDEDYFIIENNGSFGDGEIKYLHGEHVTETVKSGFSIPKLEDIFQASKFSENVTLGLGNNIPLTVKFNMITGDGFLSYLLAPRIEQE